MRVVIYRPSQEVENSCGVFLLGTPEWMIEEFLLHSGFDQADPTEASFRSEVGGEWWSARGYSRDGADGSQVICADGPSAEWHQQNGRVVSLQLHEWNHHAPLSELLGAGWWRFLSPEGERQLIPPGRVDVRSPLLGLRHHHGSAIVGTHSSGVFAVPEHANLTVLDRHRNEALSSAALTLDQELDHVACAALQSVGMYFHLAGASISRRRKIASDEVERIRLGLLFVDEEPDPNNAPPQHRRMLEGWGEDP